MYIVHRQVIGKIISMPNNSYEHGDVPEQEWRRLAAEDVINNEANRFSAELIGSLEVGSVVLDIGAGSSAAIREHVRSHEGALYVPLDTNQQALEAHRQDPEEPGVLTLNGNLREPATLETIGAASVNVVHVRYVLAFLDIEARERVMSELYRIVKPGGRIIFMDYDWSVVDGSEDVQKLREIGLSISMFDADYGEIGDAEAASFLPDEAVMRQERLEFPYPLPDYAPLLALGHIIPHGLMAEENGEQLAEEARQLFARLEEESTNVNRSGYRWPDAAATVIEKPLEISSPKE
jgi:SAM-dependent methyltransferase